MSKPDTELEGILSDAFAKYRRGEEKHGVIDIDTDRRDFLTEAEDELLDAIVYNAFQIGRLRRARARLEEPAFKRLYDLVSSLDESGLAELIEQINKHCDRFDVRRRTSPSGPEEPTL